MTKDDEDLCFIAFSIIALLAIMCAAYINADTIVNGKFLGIAPPYGLNDNSIAWTYNNTQNLTNASFDGILIENFDTRSYFYAKSNLESNTTHRFCLYYLKEDFTTEILCDNETTLEKEKTDEQQIYAIIASIIIFIIGVMFCLIGVYVPFVGYGGFIMGIIGISTSINGSFTNAILYMLLICAGFWIGYSGGKD